MDGLALMLFIPLTFAVIGMGYHLREIRDIARKLDENVQAQNALLKELVEQGKAQSPKV